MTAKRFTACVVFEMAAHSYVVWHGMRGKFPLLSYCTRNLDQHDTGLAVFAGGTSKDVVEAAMHLAEHLQHKGYIAGSRDYVLQMLQQGRPKFEGRG